MKRSIARVSALLAVGGLVLLIGPPATLGIPVTGTASRALTPIAKVPSRAVSAVRLWW
jgi:hypothetical protein